MPSIPRPHLSSHLSLSRVKSATAASSTTPNASRDASPSRANIPTTPRGNGAQLGEQKPVGLVLRLTVVKGKDLAPKDKSGTSDPFVVVTVGDAKEATSVVSKTLNPEWNQTFEIPIANPDSALLEAVCWDKDRFRNDYMGEFDILLEDIFTSGTPTPEPRWTRLEARRGARRTKKKDTNVSGEILIKFALYDPTNLAATPQQILNKFYGIVADSLGELEDEDPLARVTSKDLDDVSEAEEDRDPSDETDEGGLRTPGNEEPEQKQKRLRRARLRKLKRSKLRTFEFSGTSDVAGVLFLEINRITDLPPEKNMTRTSFDMDPFVVTSLGKKTYRTRVVRHNLNPVFDEKLVFPIQKSEQNYSLNFAVVDQDKFSNNDFVGTAIFPVEKVRSLAPEADPVTGLYRLPDPDAPEGEVKKKKWRVPLSRGNSSTSLSRLSRNSSHSNLASKVNMTSSNSSILGPDKPGIARQGSDPIQKRPPPPTSEPGELSISISGEHVEGTTTVDESGLSHFEIPLDLKNKSRWEDKHSPVLYLKAKYLPYQALRQQFWRALIKHYDADESGSIDKIEMVTMLDTLGSTLHNSTIDGFFHRFKDVNAEEVLTYDQAVICLEEQLEKTTKAQKDPHRHLPWRSKKDDPTTSTARLGTLSNDSSDSSPTNSSTPHFDNSSASNLQPKSTIPTLEVSDLSDAGEQGDRLGGDDLGESDFLAGGETDSEIHENSGEEHVVEIQECPICHQPRLQRGRRNTDADIITHIATCASGDWRAVNNLVMAGFVTSSQAQRKWYSKVISKVSYGGYRLGANSANILVQDRITGMINEERMSVYVRLGIRLLYKGLKSRDMEKKKVRKLLRSLSFKQGRKYDDPASAAQIPGFINFHQLDMGEVLLKTEEFKTFNEFFYRKLKPDARPCSAPNDPHIVVSPADCRTVVFNKLDDAQRIWVKGREFNLERLFGDAYPEDAKRFKGGALGIFRLAPQDYHRFHIPVDGVLGEPKQIDGEYYTVNPMAIRSALDVYGENIRICVPIDSTTHGRVMMVCVGAMMVGSTVITRQKGEQVKRAEELGYFKFGGSTVLVLFEPGQMVFDGDLHENSNSALETLVRVGMSIGHTPTHAPHTPDMKKSNPTNEEKQEAKRRIEGSLAPTSGEKKPSLDTALKI